MSTSKLLIAKIVPAIKLPREVMQVFSYAIPKKFEKEIKIGTLVEIPFRKRKILGVVYDVKKEKTENLKFKLKEIIAPAKNELNLSEQQIRLAEYISNYYYTPLSLVIKTIIPPVVKNKPRKEIKLNPDCKIAKIKKTETNKLFRKIRGKEKMLLIHNLQSQRHRLYSEIIKNEIKGGGQAFLLLPEFFDVYNFAKFYFDEFGQEKTAIITSELTKNQYFGEWKKIKNGSAQIIIGTRQAVFAPFKNLKLIIADNEHSSSYKQWDMNPRYHAVKAAEKLAEIWKAKIILSSTAPSVESYYKAINKQEITPPDPAYPKTVIPAKAGIQLARTTAYILDSRRSSSHTSIRDGNDKIIDFQGHQTVWGYINLLNKGGWGVNKHFEIIDLIEERKAGNYSILSEKLKNNLLDSVYKRHQAIIFIPRLGESTVTQCKDCSFIAECQNCGLPLISYTDHLYCARCKEKSELVEKCPRCKGQNISSFGYGSGKIEKEIKKLFRNKNIKISRLDSGIAQNKSKQLQIYKNFINGKIDVLVGTQMVLKNWNTENLSLAAVLLPEIIFNQPDFRSQERAFQFLMFLSNLAGQKTKVIIQSYKMENEIFKITKNNDIEKFYLQELQNRKSASKIGYPPFSRLIKLIYKNPDSKKCESEARDLFLILKNKIKSDKNLNDNFEIMPPFPASNYKEYGKYRWHIVIKSVCKDIKTRDSLLNFAKKDWIIDIDPVDIF